MIEVGDKAPEGAFERPDGSRGKLSDYTGRPLVLYFYPKADTTGCTKEAEDFSALLPEFTNAGAAVLAISRDKSSAHDKFARKYSLTVPLAADSDGSLCEAYGTWIEKSMYGRKYMGIERATFLIGADGRFARVWRKVKVPGHAAEVLSAVQAR